MRTRGHDHTSRSLFAAAAVCEALGDSVARNLLPIVAVSVLSAGSMIVGLLNSLGLVSLLFLSLPFGVLADRARSPLTLMISSSLARAAFVAAGLWAWMLGWLQGAVGLVILVAIAFAIGIADAAFSAGQGVLIPRIVCGDEIRPLYGVVQTCAQISAASGPFLISILLTIVVPPSLWLVPLLMYLISVVTQGGIRQRVIRGPAQRQAPARCLLWVEARVGLRVLIRSRMLLSVSVANSFANATAMAGNTLLPVLVMARFGYSAGLFSLLGAVGALAGAVGASCGSFLTGYFGIRRVRLCVAILQSASVAAVVLTVVLPGAMPGSPLAWLAAQALLAGAGTAITMVSGADLPAKMAPAETLGAVMGAQRLLVLGSMPVAALIVGGLGVLAFPLALATWTILSVGVCVATVTIRHRGNELPPRE